MSPKIPSEVREGADNVELNIPYEIINVEDVTTEVSAFSGIRVELLTKTGKVGSIMLWQRPVTGTASKLGVFMIALGDNTDKWLHKWITFIGWDKGNRNIVVSDTVPTTKAKPKAAVALPKTPPKSK